ncbi:MAG: dihydroneopterin aldolase [Microcystis wesenbergii Mw_QC_S_20081001_S30D]|uniref:7,8-dihydroneopterin aldolase n=1 Tax=Microcystis wesenbergii Mw_QC_S_20081001_S30D TaxID=2486245 RepID=A0A552JWK1_9CHRO|nr:dihydroneopterin aldolase [Microcystis aeruginosa W11-03]NCR93295.1 dihydroneopterin aldolase [Microcystis aeruginosa W11-06]TRU95096.1 MAG: dihydroneopterin aldolase [Microcystis wesenbergii Mw_QC_S_20081001_S30]TRV00137.1 MAG: dihydroneopterin aldolase [Microcystis wesenbergii Mw_QC_S_20081001_S30D]
MDTIHFTGIRAYGYTGYLAEEQVLGQWFEVDLSLAVDISIAGKSDAIEDTLDYRQAIEIVKHQIETSKFALVEKLATVIAEDILQLDRVRQVRVQLSKPAAPIPHFTGKITIDITRCR